MAKVKASANNAAINFGEDLVKVPKNTFDGEFPIEKIKPRVEKIRFYPDVERAALEDSIKRFGFTEPLVLTSDHVLVHGELRYELARDVFGLSAVPVVILNEEASKQALGYPLVANRLNEWSSWNHAVTDLLLLQENKIPAPKRERRKDSQGNETRQRVGIDWDADEAKGPGKMSLRTALRKIGWFTNDVPEILTANSFTLEKVAEEIVSRERSQIYQFNPEQLLFVARTRRALLRYFEDPKNAKLLEKDMPKDRDPEKIRVKEAEKAEYYQAIAADIREYDFDLNPDGSKLERREEIIDAIMAVLVSVAKQTHPELADESDEKVLEGIETGAVSVPSREFQKSMKSLDIFDILASTNDDEVQD